MAKTQKKANLIPEFSEQTDKMPVLTKTKGKNDIFSQFNRAVEESEKLNNQFSSVQKKIDETHEILKKELYPLMDTAVDERLKFFDNADLILNSNITKGQKEYLLELIRANINLLIDQYNKDVFYLFEKYFPEEAEEVQEEMDKFNENPEEYEKNFENNKKADFNKIFSEMISDVFGIDVDDEDFFNESKRERKKTKAQLKSEEKRLEKEKNEQKIITDSIKSVYVKLAKALHPDLEQNEEIRLIKTTLMQQITEAYANKDFYTLLKIAVNNEYINLQESHLDELSEESIKVYLKIIKNQNLELREKLRNLKNFENNGFYMRFCQRNIETVLSENKLQIKIDLNFLTNLNKIFQNPKKALQFIKQHKFNDPLEVMMGEF